jgi:uncharacterized protein YaiI (UPF0178 family)
MNLKRLAIRNLSTHLRDSGIRTGGPAPITHREKAQFANELDRILLRRKN